MGVSTIIFFVTDLGSALAKHKPASRRWRSIARASLSGVYCGRQVTATVNEGNTR